MFEHTDIDIRMWAVLKVSFGVLLAYILEGMIQYQMFPDMGRNDTLVELQSL